MSSKFFFLLLLAVPFFHCKKDEAPPLPTLAEFIGTWEQDRPEDGKAYDNQHLTIEFMADSTFQMVREMWKNLAFPSCSNRIEYVAGRFSLDGDQVLLKGKFYYEGFTIPTTPCPDEKEYKRTSQAQFFKGELLFYPNGNHPKARMQRK